MEVILIKKKIKNPFLYIFLLPFLLALSNCDLSGLSGDGISDAEDSGFQLLIRNYSGTEFNNCTFYLGYKVANENFIAIDSIVYKDIVIHKKGDRNLYNEEEGYSLTYPHKFSNIGLNKFGYWEPDRATIKQFSIDGRVYFKVNLEGIVSISSARATFNGNADLNILENGDLSW